MMLILLFSVDGYDILSSVGVGVLSYFSLSSEVNDLSIDMIEYIIIY